MKTHSYLPPLLIVGLVGALTIASNSSAQNASKLKMTTDIPASITTPDIVQTRLGQLKFTDGFPDDATVQKVYDNLDFQHAVQAYLTGLPAVSVEAAQQAVTGSAPPTRRF